MIQNVASRLFGMRLKNGSYLCECPSCKMDPPTLLLTEIDGKLSFVCKDGCKDLAITMIPYTEEHKEPTLEERAAKLIKEADELRKLQPTIFQEIDKLIEFNKQKSIPFGIPLFDDSMGKINPTDLILLTGPSGEGKTQMATHFTNQACLEGRRVTFFALEAFHREIESRIFYGLLADRFFADSKRKAYVPMYYRLWLQGDSDVHEALEKYRKSAEKDYEKRYGDRLNTVYRKSSTFSIKEFEKFFKDYAEMSDLIIVDHLNYFDSHDDSKSENRMTEEVMKRIRDCVLIAKKPVLLLTHVRKKDGKEKKLLPDMEDIHGSSNIFKIATKAIILGVDYSQQDIGKSSTLVKIPKDRYGEALGRYAFRVGFDLRTRSYEQKYEIGRIFRGEKGQGEYFAPLDPSKVPSWVRGEKKQLEDTI